MLIYLPFSSYLTGSGVILGLYYVVIWLLYFAKKPATSIAVSPVNNFIPSTQQKDDSALSPQVYDFTDELNALLLQSAAQGDDKVALTEAVTNLIHKYPSLKSSSFQSPISSLIKQEAADKCNVEFDAAELTAMW